MKYHNAYERAALPKDGNTSNGTHQTRPFNANLASQAGPANAHKAYHARPNIGSQDVQGRRINNNRRDYEERSRLERRRNEEALER